jgi:hypothetical protein
MKKVIQSAAIVLLLATLNHHRSNLHAQGTAFTYQGRLNSSGTAANGSYDFRFKLYADPLGNTQVGSSYLTNALPVTNGLFVTTIDFGAGIFTGGTHWLEVDVRTNAAPSYTASYTALNPFQQVAPTPNAIFAETAGNLSGTVASASLSGPYGNAVALNNAGNSISGSFTGNGANVTNVNAAVLNGLNATNFWQLGGNNVATGQFLGSTNNQPVEFWINGKRALRLEPTATNDAPNTIGGSSVNFVSPGTVGATISGGGTPAYYFPRTNSIDFASDFSTIGGGMQISIGSNSITSTVGGGGANSVGPNGGYATIGGGWYNVIGSFSYYPTIGGGGYNYIDANVYVGTIAGGIGNSLLAGAEGPAIGGGEENSIQTNASCAVIGGGYFNTIQTNATYAVIPGGYKNQAAGSGSFAAGQQAQANHQGAFVWADSQNAPYSSTTNDSFNIRAQGGVHLDNSTSLVFGNQTRQMVELYRDPTSTYIYGIGVQSSTLYERTGTNGGFAWYMGGSHNDGQNNAGGGVTLMTLSKSGGLTVNGTFVSASDRNLKENFTPVSGQEVLQKVAALPVSRWNYKNDPGTAHIGPMAQDFYAAFGVGPDDKHITTVDEGGVALAAIRGLNEKVEAKDLKIQEQAAEIAELKTRLEKLEQLMTEKLGGAK